MPALPASDITIGMKPERIFELGAEVAHRAIHLNVADQELHRAEVASLAKDLRHLGPPQGVGATSSTAKCTSSSEMSAFGVGGPLTWGTRCPERPDMRNAREALSQTLRG